MVKLDLKQWMMVVALFALLVIVFISARNCQPAIDSSAYEALRAEYSAFKERTAEKSTEIKADIEEKEAEITKIKEEIIEIQRVSVGLEREIREKDTEFTVLEQEFSLIEDKDAKISNLQNQVVKLKSSLALSKDNTTAVKKEAIKWKVAYEKQVEINESLKKQINAQIALRESCERLNGELVKSNAIKDKQLVKAKNMNTVMAIASGLGIGAGIIGILN